MKNYDPIRIHSHRIPYQGNFVEIYTLRSIPEHLSKAIRLENHKLWLDNIEGCKCVPLGSVICYEKSDKTDSGYNCWSLGQLGIDLVKEDNTFYPKNRIIHAMLIPNKDEERPLWVLRSNLTYNGDGTATLHTDEGSFTGRIGIDFILCHGIQKTPITSLLTRNDEAYGTYIVCDENRNDVGKLCELYPA